MEIGSKSRLAFSIGDKQSSNMLAVDIWLNSILLTYYDNSVYLPAFIFSLKQELQDIENSSIDSNYVFFDHGSTTDDVVSRAKITDHFIHINCELENGQKVNTKLVVKDVVAIYKSCINKLSAIAT